MRYRRQAPGATSFIAHNIKVCIIVIGHKDAQVSSQAERMNLVRVAICSADMCEHVQRSHAWVETPLVQGHLMAGGELA